MQARAKQIPGSSCQKCNLASNLNTHPSPVKNCAASGIFTYYKLTSLISCHRCWQENQNSRVRKKRSLLSMTKAVVRSSCSQRCSWPPSPRLPCKGTRGCLHRPWVALEERNSGPGDSPLVASKGNPALFPGEGLSSPLKVAHCKHFEKQIHNV